ncbi:dynamin-binding protein [Geosmithia morbida]|uniref:Dynamin-binding protein n=1 Tax=Geosmithia morbida TaxID=1094350 RepID=A0A9P4YTR6_9HYPO|nr:dynamin-binding protein [Geosmithia morbida]KAF4122397.1 dynamin-binding protein [Geosmithia morbida]
MTTLDSHIVYFTSITTRTVTAPNTNPYRLRLHAASVDHHHGAAPARAHSHDFNAVNPDDFYKSYYHNPNLEYNSNPAPECLPMATSSSHSVDRERERDRSLPRRPVAIRNRSVPLSNNNGRTPSNTTRTGLGVPAAASSGRTPYGGKPSVKDLKQRFDQNGETSSIPSPNGAPRRRRNGSDMSDASKDMMHSYSAIRNGEADQPVVPGVGSTSKTARPQRSRFVAEDQVSSNAQSFASRIGRPRNRNGANPNIPPSAQPPPPSPSFSSSPSAHSSQGLLFGEILPEQYDTSALGFGIDSLRPRGASESTTAPASHHQRSVSLTDAKPSSPGDWYRDVDTTFDYVDVNASSDSRGHGQSLSDVSAQKQPELNPAISRKGATRNPQDLSPYINDDNNNNNQTSTSSRLPLSVKRLNSPTKSSSPEPTGSGSPSSTRRPLPSGRSPRVTTPTSRNKTPVQGRIPRKAAPELPNSRLEAYIAAPPPKLSPPLRSSRPRQAVSTASTASSRMKAVDKMKPPPTRAQQPRNLSTTPEPTRRRKISVGPIDFEQRREHIRLAYSRSLRESQALEARKRAAERRRQELDAATLEEAEAQPSEGVGLGHAPQPPSATIEEEADTEHAREEPARGPVPVEKVASPEIGNLLIDLATEPAAQLVAPQSEEETETRASQASPTPPAPLAPAIITSIVESPDLGLPGSFPTSTPLMNADEPPPSAVSAATETTEFDLDTQRQSFIPPASPKEASVTMAKSPGSELLVSMPSRARAEYHSPFDEVPDVLDGDGGYHAIQGTINPHYETDYNFTHERTLQDDTSTCVSVLDDDEDDGECDDDQTESIPFPRLDMHDDSECCSDLDSTHDVIAGSAGQHGDATTDASAEDTDDQGRTEDYMSESLFGDRLLEHRASSCVTESETGDHADPAPSDLEPPDYQLLPVDTSRNLLAPHSRPPRLSQRSQWTDISVVTPNLADLAKSPAFEGPGSPTYGYVTIFGSRVLSRDSDLARREAETTPQTERDSYHSDPSASYLEHEIPPNPEHPNEDLAAQALSPAPVQNLPHMPSPNHDPPPVPLSAPSSSLDERNSGAFYDDRHQYSSDFVDPTQEVGEYMQQVGTPQTMSTGSINALDRYSGSASQRGSNILPENPDGEEPLPDKERHRLVQRRNVLKELIDTEAVFVRDMNIVEEIYKGTAEACPKLDANTVKQIFRNTDDIIAFHTTFLVQIKEAVASVYVPKSSKSAPPRPGMAAEGTDQTEISDAKDRDVALGPVFGNNIDQMKLAHEGFLRSSDLAAKRLIQIQQDPTVKVWLNECNEVAKEFTAAWDLDSLLIKPMQRITKYPNLIITILQHTPQDHPDREALMSAKETLEEAIIDINKTKKNFELVGQIVGRKRKESDVRNGFARAFGKRVDKLQVAGGRLPEDPDYTKLNERFGDDYLRLQVVLRDVEFYTRQVSSYVREFLQYMSSVELVMRLQPGHYPEIESKWVQFNISIQDIEKVALEDHLAQVRKQVIEPFEQVIKAYGNPSLAMKKRQKRRLDYERMEQLKRSGKSSGDSKLQELVEQYEALNDALKKELPKLSALTEKVGNICLGNFVNIQAAWYAMWSDKMRSVLEGHPNIPDLDDIVSTFQQDFPYIDEQLATIGILGPQVSSGRPSLSTAASADDSLSKKTRSPRPSDVDTMRSRGMSTNGESVPYLPTPDFRDSGSLSMSPTGKGLPSPHHYYYRDYYTGIMPQASSSSATAAATALNMTPELAGSYRSLAATGATAPTRPSTGRSFDSGGIVPRQSTDSADHQRRDSNMTYNSMYPQQESRRFSGLFHSALPLPDGPDDGGGSRLSSRASSRERGGGPGGDGYNVLWLAASLFEFNIATTKHEAGYPYLTYQAGEIFDVIAEKGELWLAKNQDDPTEQVGWIWSKHFAKLADFS